MHAQIVRRGVGSGPGGDGRGDVDIEVLLSGAEKLCNVYPLPGALERIPAQRQKYAQLNNTLAYYETKVAEQQEALEKLNVDRWAGEDDEEEERSIVETQAGMTVEDLRREEEEVRELDRKKRDLQERLRAMESDLGGLLNI